MSVTQIVSMFIGSMEIGYVETRNGEWLDEEADIKKFCKSLNAWEVKQGLGLVFDGCLDSPEKFTSIELVSVNEESSVKCNRRGLEVSDFSFVLEVTSESGLDEEELEDLFHIVIPKVEIHGAKIGFTDFSDYEVNV